EAIAKIPHTTARHLVVLIMETGLRGGDACNLPFNPVLADSSGWPCLRFEATKVRAEQLIPLSAKAAAAIRAQQDYVRQRWPAGSPWLFPGMMRNDDGRKPYSHRTFIQQLEAWQRTPGLRAGAGRPVRVTRHQFRHTLGTRLINSGVPQHVVQKLLGHASPGMTGHYAKIHDATIREAFDRYQSQRVNIAGQRIGYDPGAPTASAEWVKHNLNRVRDSLPNGYCARPPRTRRPPPPARLPAPQRLPPLPSLPDPARVPADPPAPGHGQPASHRPSRRRRPGPARREPAPRPSQPGGDHPRPRSAR